MVTHTVTLAYTEGAEGKLRVQPNSNPLFITAENIEAVRELLSWQWDSQQPVLFVTYQQPKNTSQ